MSEQSTRRPLPDSWVERIFDRMQGLYGSLWVDRWRSGEMIERAGRQFDKGTMVAKATWAQELAGFADSPDRIAKALEVCRNRNLPPTLPEFIAMCREQYEELQRLPAPTMTREEAAPCVAAMVAKVAAPKQDFLAWAKSPPEKEHRERWANAICDCLERGDERFRKILAEHVASGVIVSARAQALLVQDAEHEAAA